VALFRGPGLRGHLVNLRGRRNPLARGPDRPALAAWLRERDVEVLIVDPFGRAYTGASQNDSGEVGAWLVALDTFARGQAGAREVVLTAHAGWDGERTRGSSALEDWADAILTLTRGKDDDADGRYLRAVGRDVDVEEDRLEFDATTRTLSRTGTGSRRTGQRTRAVAAARQAVLAYVAANPGCSGQAIRATSTAGTPSSTPPAAPSLPMATCARRPGAAAVAATPTTRPHRRREPRQPRLTPPGRGP